MTTRTYNRASNGRFMSEPREKHVEFDIVHDARTVVLLKELIDHVENVKGLYQESDQHSSRRAYLALRADLGAVYDCFEELRESSGHVKQLNLFFGTGDYNAPYSKGRISQFAGAFRKNRPVYGE